MLYLVSGLAILSLVLIVSLVVVLNCDASEGCGSNRWSLFLLLTLCCSPVYGSLLFVAWTTARAQVVLTDERLRVRTTFG